MEGGGDATRRAEEAVLRHCEARGLLPPGRVDALRLEAAASGVSLLSLLTRNVPRDAIPELRRVHRDALDSDPSMPPLLRGDPSFADAPWQEADTFLLRSSEDQATRTGTERFDRPLTERLDGPPRYAVEPPAPAASDTIEDYTTLPIPAAGLDAPTPARAAEAFEDRDTVKDLPAVGKTGDTTIRVGDAPPIPLPDRTGETTKPLADPLPIPLPGGSAAIPMAGGVAPSPRAPAGVVPALPLGRTWADGLASAPNAAAALASTSDELPVLIGPFPVQGELGRGRAGVVYRAWHAELGRDVAIRVPPPRAGAAECERFLAGARAMARLRHPSIVMVHEVGEAAGRPYLVTDLVAGRTLTDVLKAESHLPAREAAAVAQALALGLAEGHRRSVLHLGLRPGGVILGPRREPVLTEFGLAAAPDLRSAPYLAPEQAVAGGAVDRRADVRAVGALLYHLLTGEPPAAGETLEQVLQAVREREPAPPSTLVEGVDGDLEAVVLRCLERDPEERYASAQDLAVDLGRWLEGLPVRRPPLLGRLARWARRHPVLVSSIVGATVVLATIAGVVTFLLARR